jgi:hypothetical protein
MKAKNNTRKVSFLVFQSLLLALLFAALLTSSAQAFDHRLEIIGGPITIKSKAAQATAMSFFVTVRNNGPEIPLLIFRAVSDDGNPITVKLLGQQAGIHAYAVAQFEIEFPNLVTKKISGHLIIEADQVEPAAETLTLEPFVDGLKGALPGIALLDTSQIIEWSFWFGFVFIFLASWACIIFQFRSKEDKLKNILNLRMTGLKWDFKENWASTFVAVGGVLGTLISSDIMPENPVLISKQGFQMLNILFLILIVVAPFLLSILNSLLNLLFGDPKKNLHSEDSKKNLHSEDYKKGDVVIVDSEGKPPLLILPFVVGSALVSWAVLGELLTQIVLFQELSTTGLLTQMVTGIAQWVMQLFALLGMIYVLQIIAQTASTAKTLGELRDRTDPSGVIKATNKTGRPERPVYLP